MSTVVRAGTGGAINRGMKWPSLNAPLDGDSGQKPTRGDEARGLTFQPDKTEINHR